MNILAISGSVRSGSYNLALLRAMKKLSPQGTSITVYDKIKEIPIFDPDVDDSIMPDSVYSLTAMMRESDAVIISTPEYAHGIPGALKNTLDWMVSSDALILKPVVVTSVSTSGLGGVRSHSSLLLILSAMNANVIVAGSMNIPYAKNIFDASLNLTDELTKKAIAVSFIAIKQALDDC